jgi:hypothetical protein
LVDPERSVIPFSELAVVGSTIVPRPDDLPRRLIPIYERRGYAGVFYLPMDEEGEQPPRLALEKAEILRERASEGDVCFFQRSFPAQPAHWLIQIEEGAPPEYLLAKDGERRLETVGEAAMAQAAQALRAGDELAAEKHAWYAFRALPRDPLPHLALLALLRDLLPPKRFRIFEQGLAQFPSEAVERARRRLMEARYRPFGDLLEAHRRLTKSPRYLPPELGINMPLLRRQWVRA